MNEGVKRWGWPAGLALAVLAAGVIIALLQPSSSDYLDPNSTGPDGGHALADLLTARGQQVVRVDTPPATGTTTGTSLELITSPNLLTGAQLAQAARFDGDIILTDPDPAALRAIAPEAIVTAIQPGVIGTAPPLCNVQAANLAGDIDTGGAILQPASQTGNEAAADECYPGGGGYGLIQYKAKHSTITVLGSSAPLTNAYLADEGDAALALNLLRQASGITWVVPNPAAAPPASGTAQGRQRSFFSLIPWPVYLIVIQLALAALVAAAWRARRLGPLVAERLPVIVRASETVEGHGRLYQARRARDRAAQELRAAARARISARTGQPPGTVTGPELDGPPPASDADLVTLAEDLDELERKVRNP
ncbi:MAG TPA: DUF4350 domain-containing protein [Trebonia sp.]